MKIDNNKKVWLTSDSHFMHKNIAGPSCSSWESGYRNFNSVEEMSQTIVDTFNKYVEKDDILIHLGDWSFGGKENIWNFRKQLNVNEIHLCLGNHDHHIKNNIKLQNCFHSVRGGLVSIEESTSDYDEPCKAKELFQTVKQVIEFEFKNYNFFCSHYKHAIWNGSHQGFIHLYGHSHASAEDFIIGKSMDVGIDNAFKLFGEYRPFTIEEIISLMKKREIHFFDHHQKNTNVY